MNKVKRPFIWTAKKRGFNLLWIWRIALIYCHKVDDKHMHGIWLTKRAILFFVNKKGIGVGHSFRAGIEAYK